jgi:hypothetical protein
VVDVRGQRKVLFTGNSGVLEAPIGTCSEGGAAAARASTSTKAANPPSRHPLYPSISRADRFGSNTDVALRNPDASISGLSAVRIANPSRDNPGLPPPGGQDRARCAARAPLAGAQVAGLLQCVLHLSGGSLWCVHLPKKNAGEDCHESPAQKVESPRRRAPSRYRLLQIVSLANCSSERVACDRHFHRVERRS